jgi:hypothetical protein
MLKDRIYLSLAAAALGLLFAASAGAAEEQKDQDTYDQDSVIKDATAFFGKGTEGLGKVIEKAFQDQGRPNGYIKGKEVSGALVAGLRYGNGTLTLKNKASRKVHWQGPSIGFDVGGNASKVFVLVYNLQDIDNIFQRFPAVDGSFYYIAGAGINYQQSEKIVLAPIRLGVGLRLGINIGYMHYTRTKSWNPL